MSQPQMSSFPQIPLSKLIPAAIVGLIGFAAVAAVVGNWVMDIMDSSYRTQGRYAQMLEAPKPPKTLPKDSYLCPANEKSPWIGCAIR
jgi:hypothetical protein